MERRPTTLVLAASGAAAVASASIPGTTGPIAIRMVSGVAVVVLSWLAVRRVGISGARGVRSWQFIAAGLTLFVAGDVLFDGFALANSVPPTVSVADVLYLAGYPLFAAGIAGLVRDNRINTRDGLLDGAILAAAATVVTWQFLIDDGISDGSVPILERAVYAAYPLGDLLLIAALGWLMLSGAGRERTTSWMLAFLTIMLSADLGYSIVANAGLEVPARLLDPLYTVGYGCVLAAALCASDPIRAASRDAGRLHPGRVLFLGLALFAAPLVTVVRQLRDEKVNGVLIILSSLAIAGLVLSRLLLLVAERERATARHRASEARFRTLATSSPVGIFQLDCHGTVQFANPELVRLYGFSPVGDSVTALVAAAAPPDVELVRAALTPTPGARERGVAQYDVVRPDGSVRTAKLIGVRLDGSADDGCDGSSEFLGTVYDVTDELGVRDQVARFAELLDAAPDVIAVADPVGRLLSLNAAGRACFGTPDEHGALGLLDLFSPRSQALLAIDALPAVAGGGNWRGQAELEPVPGLVTPVSVVLVGHTDDAGRLTYLSAIARDISDVTIAHERLLHLAGHDSLTGLVNRTSFREHLDEELARAVRGRTSVALLYCDLDGFKRINDTWGHAAGDQVLVATAGRLRAAARDVDCVARLGGDEFVLILPGADRPQAVTVAERIIRGVVEPMPLGPVEVTVGVSIGVAISTGGRATADEMLAEADMELYRAKLDGKGCVRSRPGSD